MSKNVKEANVMLAKCRKTHQTYGIRVERRMNDIWYCTWAFPISDRGAANEGYGSVAIAGRVENDAQYPGCPYCKGISWVSCGRCQKLTCHDGKENHFNCKWCGNSGIVYAASSFDLEGGGY